MSKILFGEPVAENLDSQSKNIFEEYIKNETKSLNLKLLSEETRNFIPEISGNFCKDKKYFSKFWENVKLEKKFLKKQKKISKKNIKDVKQKLELSQVTRIPNGFNVFSFCASLFLWKYEV